MGYALGQVGVDEFLSDPLNLRVLDVEEPILMNYPDIAPLMRFTQSVGQSRDVTDVKYWWLTDEQAPREVVIATNFVGGTDTMIEVPAGKGRFFDKHMVFLASNGVQFRANGVNYGAGTGGADQIVIDWKTSATKSRVDQATTITTSHNMTAGTGRLFLMGQSMGEKSDVDLGYTEDPVPIFNLIQNFYAAVSLSTTANRVKTYGGNRRAQDHRKRQMEIAQQIEMAYFLGKPAWDSLATGEGSVGMLGGLRQSVATNGLALSGWSASATPEQDLIALMPQILEYTTPENVAFFGSAKFVAKIASFGLGKLLVRPEDKTWGFAPTKWVSPFGEIPIHRHRFFDNYNGGLFSMVVTMGECKKVNFPDGAIKMMPNRQNNSQYQLLLDIYTGQYGFEWGREKRHSIVSWT